MIVSTVLDHTCNADNVELIAANTGLLIMLIYFWKSLMGQIIMRTEATKKHKVIERDFGVIAECTGDVRKYLTFAMLSVDAIPPQRSMDKVNRRY